MSQHDYNITNQTAINFRADLNTALSALVSNSSGDTEPNTRYPNMFWYDSLNNLLKIRNESNSAWITVGNINQADGVFRPYINNKWVGDFLDEDTLATNSATSVPSQQSVKAYVDDKTAGLKMKVGSGDSTSDSEEFFAFDTPFENECVHVTISRIGQGFTYPFYPKTLSPTGFTIDRNNNTDNTGDTGFTYVAYGN